MSESRARDERSTWRDAYDITGEGGCESIQADVVIVIAGGSYVE